MKPQLQTLPGQKINENDTKSHLHNSSPQKINISSFPIPKLPKNLTPLSRSPQTALPLISSKTPSENPSEPSQNSQHTATDVLNEIITQIENSKKIPEKNIKNSKPQNSSKPSKTTQKPKSKPKKTKTKPAPRARRGPLTPEEELQKKLNKKQKSNESAQVTKAVSACLAFSHKIKTKLAENRSQANLLSEKPNFHALTSLLSSQGPPLRQEQLRREALDYLTTSLLSIHPPKDDVTRIHASKPISYEKQPPGTHHPDSQVGVLLPIPIRLCMDSQCPTTSEPQAKDCVLPVPRGRFGQSLVFYRFHHLETSPAPPPEEPRPTEADVCSICYSGESSPVNMIIYCDGVCHKAYHQLCYGVDKIPAGNWFCKERDCVKIKAKRSRRASSASDEEYVPTRKETRVLDVVLFWRKIARLFEIENIRACIDKFSIASVEEYVDKYGEGRKSVEDIPPLGESYKVRWKKEDEEWLSLHARSRVRKSHAEKSPKVVNSETLREVPRVRSRFSIDYCVKTAVIPSVRRDFYTTLRCLNVTYARSLGYVLERDGKSLYARVRIGSGEFLFPPQQYSNLDARFLPIQKKRIDTYQVARVANMKETVHKEDGETCTHTFGRNEDGDEVCGELFSLYKELAFQQQKNVEIVHRLRRSLETALPPPDSVDKAFRRETVLKTYLKVFNKDAVVPPILPPPPKVKKSSSSSPKSRSGRRKKKPVTSSEIAREILDDIVRDVCVRTRSRTPPPSPPRGLYCICKTPENVKSSCYVCCDECHQWFHPQCVGLSNEECETAIVFICPLCEKNTLRRTKFRTRGTARQRALQEKSRKRRERVRVFRSVREHSPVPDEHETGLHIRVRKKRVRLNIEGTRSYVRSDVGYSVVETRVVKQSALSERRRKRRRLLLSDSDDDEYVPPLLAKSEKQTVKMEVPEILKGRRGRPPTRERSIMAAKERLKKEQEKDKLAESEKETRRKEAALRKQERRKANAEKKAALRAKRKLRQSVESKEVSALATFGVVKFKFS